MTYRVIYKPTGELVLDAAARLRRERARRIHTGGLTTHLMNEVGFPALERALWRVRPAA